MTPPETRSGYTLRPRAILFSDPSEIAPARHARLSADVLRHHL